jgi:hypothetical protein
MLRKKNLIEFEFGDSGRTVYFVVQLENDDKKEAWKPLVFVTKVVARLNG